jgi:hypothetical protein
MQSTLKTTFSSCKVLANSSNSPLPAIPDQSTNHIALAYRQAICLVISHSYFDMKKPFTKEEKEIMDLLVEAHNKFAKIEQTHPSDINEWVDLIHRCQSILQGRVVRRDYPDVFHSC